MNEWIASEIMLMDPLITPTISFNIMSRELEKIDNRAILTFLFIKMILYKINYFTKATTDCFIAFVLRNYLSLPCNKPFNP